MVIAFLEVLFLLYLLFKSSVIWLTHEWQLQNVNRCSVAADLEHRWCRVVILLHDQSTTLTSGLDWCLKKEKRNPCALTRKLTSANPHEASPVTSTNAPNHNLYMCFTSVHTTDTKISASWPSHSSSRWVFLFFIFYFFLGACITFDWCCSNFKNHSLLGDRGLSTFPTKVQKRQLNMVITYSSSLVVIRHSSSFDHYDVWKVI